MPISTAKRRGRLRAAAFAGIFTAATLSGAGIASAEGDPTRGGASDTYTSPEQCADQSEEFRFRFYYNSNYGGAWVNIGHSLPDLARLEPGGSYPSTYAMGFCDKGNGAGKNVANNAASAFNWYRGYCATVHYNSWYRGATDQIYPNTGENLSATKNNNRSISFRAC
ncbi:hypothetical protein ABZ419_05920 [Streptomyces cinnamoneus]|uniref:hypothetical protein n=1 Tax=Streptomyces cinnamoneus TaxID=53446 RepID=UPI0033ED9AD0